MFRSSNEGNIRSPMFKRATAALHLDLLNDEEFQNSIKRVTGETGQSMDLANEFVLILAEIDSDALENDRESFLAACLEALKLSIRDQESILILISENHRTLQNALERLRKLQELEDMMIESPVLRLKTEKSLSLRAALDKLESQAEEKTNESKEQIKLRF